MGPVIDRQSVRRALFEVRLQLAESMRLNSGPKCTPGQRVIIGENLRKAMDWLSEVSRALDWEELRESRDDWGLP